ncbi:MAG: DUF2807 domain-containing protein [bacterium]|nr:DUF2807 domain-containing protein [bacterium]
MPDTLTVRERREVASFRAVELRYFGHLHLVQGPETGVEIEGDPDVLAKVHARVAGDTLVLEIGETWLERLTSGILLVANRPLHYHVTAPEIDRVAVSGTGEVSGDALRADRLELTVSGTADPNLTGIACDELAVAISGRGSFELGGRAERLHLRVSGSGDVDAGELACHGAEVRISGQGNATPRVSDKLDVRISGLGEVRYHGDPTVTQRISGVGGVSQLSAG